MNTSILNIISRAQKSHQLEILDTQILVAHTLNKPREWVVSHPEFSLSFWQLLKIRQLIRKRAKGVPIAYLTGHKEFFGFDFFVNKHTLVPRPDTEILVESVLNSPPDSTPPSPDSGGNIVLIDIGTGSGCIPIAIQKTVQQKYPSLKLKTFATDISTKALKVAQKNAQKHKAEMTFFQGNLLEPILKNKNSLFGDRDTRIILTANLPYLTQKQFDEEHSIQHEPHLALVADDNGLALYKILLEQIQFLVSNFKSPITCYFEIDPSQAVLLSEYIQNIFPDTKIEIIKDLCGRDRIIKIDL